MTTYEFEAGRLLCGRIRSYLKECQFGGLDITWTESSGFFVRTFKIKGDRNAVALVANRLKSWAKKNNLE